MKFAHLGDCHLGGWSQPELSELNFKSFQYAINLSIKEKVDFILIAGDLFDSAYPSIDIIKETFNEFRKIKEANIPVFLIAGSHDYSVSGKTFLDVLEKSGFAKNVYQTEQVNDKKILIPTIYKNIAIYGYPGKKSGLEVPEIPNLSLQDAPGLFKILMLHTSLRDAVGTLPIPAVDQTKLPKVDYVALAHLHMKYHKENRIYCGPTFPNTSSELEELQGGSFYIIDAPGKPQRKEIRLKEVITVNLNIIDALTATEKILNELKKHDIKDKIIILKLYGILERGKHSDINFPKIYEYTREHQAYTLLRNTNKLKSQEAEITFELNSENIEEEIIEKFQRENPNKFNNLISQLNHTLQIEKKEDELSKLFETRLLAESRKILGI